MIYFKQYVIKFLFIEIIQGEESHKTIQNIFKLLINVFYNSVLFIFKLTNRWNVNAGWMLLQF